MALWGSNDQANNAPKWTVAGGLGVAANGSQLWANTQASAFVSGMTLGTFGISTTEQSNTAQVHGGHAGWNLRKVGSGGRAGRIHVETLIAMGSMTQDGTPTANDNTVFPDA